MLPINSTTNQASRSCHQKGKTVTYNTNNLQNKGPSCATQNTNGHLKKNYRATKGQKMSSKGPVTKRAVTLMVYK
jgi:hypothetical protein